MILASAPKQIQRSQEKVAALAPAVLAALDDAERRLQREDCNGAWSAVFKTGVLLTSLAVERQRAGLSPEGPFGRLATARMDMLRERAEGACGGAIAYRR